jgi:hypothetical protein
MEPIINTIITIGVGLFAGLLAWIFKDSRNAIWKEINEQTRRIELNEALLREFENVKYSEIINALNALRTDIAVIKSEIKNLSKQ